MKLCYLLVIVLLIWLYTLIISDSGILFIVKEATMLSISVLSLVVNFPTPVSLHFVKIKFCVLFESKNWGDNNIYDGRAWYQGQE